MIGELENKEKNMHELTKSFVNNSIFQCDCCGNEVEGKEAIFPNDLNEIYCFDCYEERDAKDLDLEG